jgi:O-antigen ligase
MMLIDVARALASIGMIMMAISGIICCAQNWQSCKEKRGLEFLSLVGIFLILLPSFFYSENKEYLFERWQIALPFLILPIVWLKGPNLKTNEILSLYAFYIVCVSLVAIHAFTFYLFHLDAVNELYLHSQVMPTLVSHHPTFSLMCAFGTFIGWTLYNESFYFKYPKTEKILWAVLALFLFLFTHVFSVRIGLLSLYGLIFLQVFIYIFKKKKILNGLIALLIILGMGAVILFLSPTFGNKIINTNEDLEAMKEEGSANNKSLASRMISYKNAIEIAQNSSWLFGCGLGDVRDLNTQLFKEKYPDVSKPIIPHNQFLYLLAATGLLGFVLFFMMWIYPLWKFKSYAHPFLWGIYTLMFLAFQVEAVLETQLGVAFCIFFILLGIQTTKSQKSLTN